MLEDTQVSAGNIEAGEALCHRRWDFVKGVVAIEHLPAADRGEIAFAGRSNVGKSSLINALLRQSGLARTSNTPGRTQELNVFAPAAGENAPPVYLFDLPGYGFAKAPKDKVDTWTTLVKDYLRGRPTLKRVFLLIDSRHGIKPVDLEIMEMLDISAVSYQAVLTKTDKIKVPKVTALLEATAKTLSKHPAAYPEVLAVSSLKNQGLSELRGTMARVLEIEFSE
ncbi:MAG: ribosome biogenesis GTP-binding protein YihA/YsxC [Alphaproteobacteria bacterium]|nr:ribosome biogenesis GTP-binding protein YihA/YsxC [Alphaproteobacteria bacterium]